MLPALALHIGEPKTGALAHTGAAHEHWHARGRGRSRPVADSGGRAHHGGQGVGGGASVAAVPGATPPWGNVRGGSALINRPAER